MLKFVQVRTQSAGHNKPLSLSLSSLSVACSLQAVLIEAPSAQDVTKLSADETAVLTQDVTKLSSDATAVPRTTVKLRYLGFFFRFLVSSGTFCLQV